MDGISSGVKSQSVVVIEFAQPDSVNFTIKVGAVSPLQLLALAAYLETTAKSALIEQIEMQRIQVPKGVPPNLRR